MNFTTASPVDIMQRLMDRGYGPNQRRLAQFMGVTQPTIQGWSTGSQKMSMTARLLAEQLAKRKAPRKKQGATQRTGDQGKP